MFFLYPSGRQKAMTFSFDDGFSDDLRLLEILNRYHMKCTWNLNSRFLQNQDHVKTDEIGKHYQGHEIACHGATHGLFTYLPMEDIISEIREDRRTFEKLLGHPVTGLAYPNGYIANWRRRSKYLASSIPRQSGVQKIFCCRKIFFSGIPPATIRRHPFHRHRAGDIARIIPPATIRRHPSLRTAFFTSRNGQDFRFSTSGDTPMNSATTTIGTCLRISAEKCPQIRISGMRQTKKSAVTSKPSGRNFHADRRAATSDTLKKGTVKWDNSK